MNLTALILVLISVLLNIVNAVILKELADHTSPTLLVLAAAFGAVIISNGLRFLVWGIANRRFPLSDTYPITSIFFPLMLIVAYLYGDPIRLQQLVGTVFITAGVFWIARKAKTA